MNVKNRKCIRHLSFRFLWASRKRNIIAIAAIILTTLLFTSLFTVVMSINSSYETYTFRQIGGYCHGTFKEVNEEQIRGIAGHPKVKAVGERTVIGTISSGVFAKVPAEVSFMDENCTTWSYAKPDTGHMPQSGKEITMDTGALALLGLDPQLGAEITLTYNICDKNQIAHEKTDTFTLVGWWEYDDICPVHFINISREYAEAVEEEGMAEGMEEFRTDLNVMLESAIDIRGQMEQVDSDLGYTWENSGEENNVRIGVNWGYTTAQMSEGMDAATLLGIIAFLALVIFTGYLIIYNIFQISVTGDIRFYGLLKTIGVTPRQLRRIIRQQALLLCIVGIPVGLLLGYGVGILLMPVIMEQTSFGAGVTTISTSPLIFLASALFALITVLLSCFRPGRIAAKVSPVEAVKYTEATQTKKTHRQTRGAKVHQMAFANLGRSKSKTILVVISLGLSVVLLNVLVTFTNGFDMEKYLEKQSCADFIVSSTDYFRSAHNIDSYISRDMIEQIETNTSQTISGCGYTLSGCEPTGWVPEEMIRRELPEFVSGEMLETSLSIYARRGELLGANAQIEGLDDPLFEKLTVIDGDIQALLSENDNAIALVVDEDDYGNVMDLEDYPPLGATQTITYIEEAYYIDNRTGEKCDENTPEEFLEYYIAKSHDVDYTICAYVTVPQSMSFRYYTLGYRFVLPVDRLESDSRQTRLPLFYLFDTPDIAAEQTAENYLADLTEGDLSGLMYESKSTLRAEFENFQKMFLLLGGLLCAIIGVVGILNFFNAVMTGILSRRREFAVLQSVGMTARQLKSMLVYEGLFYALGASLAALLLSLVLNPLTGNVLENMFWFFTANFTILPVLLAIPIFALLGWLIPSVMYGQTAKQSVVERLREAE